MPVPFNVKDIRSDFPILKVQAYGHDLAYFDNAATTQKPVKVIDTLTDYYTNYNANIHRGVHYLSQKASQAYDDVRVRVRGFINATSENEIVFTRGTTESINLVAWSYGERYINEGDEIIITAMEHHSNIVPWQLLCGRKKAALKVLPLQDDGSVDVNDLGELITERTRLISVVHTSNSLGTVNPVKEICEIARRNNVHVLVDAAQVMVHEPVDVQDLGCDFLAFSGHKMLGPTGVGCLYGKQELLETLPPYQGGGEMIQSVSFEKTTYNDIPFRFEAGTPNIADVIALGAAIDYLDGMDRKGARDHESDLLEYATAELQKVDGLRIYGTAINKAPVVSFLVEGLNALDLGMYLDTKGVAVRTGHHCTEPVMDFFKIPGTLRASFLFYNTREEIDRLVTGLHGGIKLLRG